MNLLSRWIFSILFLSFLPAIAFGFPDETWRPVTPAELAMKTPQVEPNADAEAIFWEVWLDDKKRSRLSYDHYVRVKIFTEAGREKFSKFDIPFYKGRRVEDVAARVIKPDGSIVELQPSDIFEREIVKVGKVKVTAKSFAVPGIEPGVIVEYRYKEIIKNDSLDGERLFFQRDIPMQRVTYYVRPYKGMSLGYSNRNMPDMRFSQNSEGFYVGTLTNVPALREEPRMPPEDEVRYWVALSYRSFGTSFSWRLLGRGLALYLQDVLKLNKELERKAAALTANASTREEKLRRLYDFAQKQIRNVSYDQSFTDEQREKLKIKDADDVLKRGMGTARDIDLLFAALAKASGFSVALVLSGDRSDNFFDPNRDSGAGYVHPAGIGVIVDNKWTYYNPGAPYMPFGRIDWYEEDTQALVADETGYLWKKIPMSDPEDSPARRKGEFNLLEDGTLEGLVTLEFEGHQAISRRRAGFRESASKREESAKEEITDRIKTAEVSDITIQNFENPEKPLTYIFKVRVPNYAQKTGKRLFLQPGFFEYGSNPVFSSEDRRYGVYFSYPWEEKDNISIRYPEGFELDNADTPAEAFDPKKIGFLKIFIGVNKETNTLYYKRDFHFGAGGKVLFPANVYTPLKTLFDMFHRADTHTITLKQN
ncbi:MAG: DUF3857 and transglutaminase domain-containing protein [Pyrinomonadaceae bacterium]